MTRWERFVAVLFLSPLLLVLLVEHYAEQRRVARIKRENEMRKLG